MNRREKIKMAIWMFNQLIDRYPEIYIALKDNYIEINKKL